MGYLRSMAVIVAGWYRQHMPSGYRRVPHGLRSHGPYSGWSVYVSAKACGELPDAICSLNDKSAA
ncbi:hypothetical protein J4734_11865 [Klebsiella pneumoniae]|uniref:Uncharacterized protein n=1 Tax=Klebsiella pneumoniae TaxID=573 RepID=A0A939NN06_KLEPN|nr:hypothetical protein [Klebsiella pneumoniae]